MNKHANSLRKLSTFIYILLTILLIVFVSWKYPSKFSAPTTEFKVWQVSGSKLYPFDDEWNYKCPILHRHIFEKPEPVLDCEPPTWEERVDSYVDGACENYPDVPPALIKSIIYYESRYQPNVSNGSCVGLMQVSTRWHADRAARLGVTDLYDPKGNILVGVDYVNDLIQSYGNIYVVLMVYNGDNNASRYYTEGYISSYAKSVVSRQQELEVNAIATKEGW